MVKGSIPSRRKILSFSPNIHTSSDVHPASHAMGRPTATVWCMQLTNHLHPGPRQRMSAAALTPLICLHSMERDGLAFHLGLFLTIQILWYRR